MRWRRRRPGRHSSEADLAEATALLEAATARLERLEAQLAAALAAVEQRDEWLRLDEARLMEFEVWRTRHPVAVVARRTDRPDRRWP